MRSKSSISLVFLLNTLSWQAAPLVVPSLLARNESSSNIQRLKSGNPYAGQNRWVYEDLFGGKANSLGGLNYMAETLAESTEKSRLEGDNLLCQTPSTEDLVLDSQPWPQDHLKATLIFCSKSVFIALAYTRPTELKTQKRSIPCKDAISLAEELLVALQYRHEEEENKPPQPGPQLEPAQDIIQQNADAYFTYIDEQGPKVNVVGRVGWSDFRSFYIYVGTTIELDHQGNIRNKECPRSMETIMKTTTAPA